jgi:hypothetical protein
MTKKPSYAILRIGKIKSLATLDAVEWHNTRQIPAGTVEGLPPPEDLAEMSGTYRERFARVLAETGATWEQGKILAVEVLVTASPEWWEKAALDEKKEWWKAQLRFANDLFGPGLIAFTPHVDESTPHAQFVGLPLYRDIKRKPGPKPKTAEAIQRRAEEEALSAKIWRLSHDRVFGGSAERLADLQTTYHGYVKHLGLARGRDTVGVGIKHTTLKHYKKLLTQMDRDLAREAAEQQEERQVLDHYDAELREKYNRFYEDRLDLFRQEEEFRIKRQALDARQHELNMRESKLEVRVKLFEERERELEESALALRAEALAEAEARALADQRRIEADRERLEKRDQQVQLREGELATREQAADTKDQSLKEEDARQKSVAAQLSVVGGFFTGRLSGRWDTHQQRPHVTTGVLSQQDRDALSQPWPEWLKLAVRRAAQMAAARSAIAGKVRRIVASLRMRRKEARSASVAAENRITQAAAKEASAARLMAMAQENEAAMAKAATAVVSRISDAREEVKLAEAARDVALSDEAEAKRSRAKVEGKTTLLRNELAGLRTEKSDIAASVETLREERETLENEIRHQRSEGERLEEGRRQLERDQHIHAEATARADRSRQLVEDLFADKAAIEPDGDDLRIDPGPAAPQRDPVRIARTDLEPWVMSIADQHRSLLLALGRTEEVEEWLKKTRATLEARYPERAEELRKDQAEETKELDRRLFRQPPGVDGVGM